MTPKEKLEKRIEHLKSSFCEINRNSPGHWSTTTDSDIAHNATVYHRLNEAEYLLKELFGDETE